MKTIKVSEATDIQLDWLVAKCEADKLFRARLGRPDNWDGAAYRAGNTSDERWVTRVQVANVGWFADYTYNPSTDWSQGGPIIEREGIQLHVEEDRTEWMACRWGWQRQAYGPTPLIAAMRCCVASKLGEEVEVPDELVYMYVEPMGK